MLALGSVSESQGPVLKIMFGFRTNEKKKVWRKKEQRPLWDSSMGPCCSHMLLGSSAQLNLERQLPKSPVFTGYIAKIYPGIQENLDIGIMIM